MVDGGRVGSRMEASHILKSCVCTLGVGEKWVHAQESWGPGVGKVSENVVGIGIVRTINSGVCNVLSGARGCR